MFPPTVNLIRNVSVQNILVDLYSCKNHKLTREISFESVRQFRYNTPAQNGISKVNSLLRHVLFNLSTFINLVKSRPDVILYYESFSALPVYLYKKLFINTKVIIHCHEYYSREWYQKQSKLLQWYHQLEKGYLYNEAGWISQTNDKRRELFLEDLPFLDERKVRVVPNYPPKDWQNETVRKRNNSDNKKFVYIGTLSSDYTYIEEFCEWIKKNNDFQLDIYSYNLDKQARDFLKKLNAPNVKFHEKGIEYDKIPELLKHYDIGLILYKALTVNFKYNATNKLFEYLVCDLDVWFPKEMLGCYEFVTDNSWPVIKMVDFNNIDASQIKNESNASLQYQPKHYSCEEAFKPLINELIK